MHWYPEDCTVTATVGANEHHVDLIQDSCAAGALSVTKKAGQSGLATDVFQFSYTAFTFGTQHNTDINAVLSCKVKLCVLTAGTSTNCQTSVAAATTNVCNTKFAAYQYAPL